MRFIVRPLYVLETLWYKDGIPIDNTGITYHSHDPWNRTLSLFNANLTFTGKYKCVVSLRNVTVEAEAQVTVLGGFASQYLNIFYCEEWKINIIL